ncbi:MAG TPA: dihydrolipoyl dehydrogenase [Anaerolineales bacterium]|nr:dihydrolipoyl dehydrogenase [Anaerolineales bacterium]
MPDQYDVIVIGAGPGGYVAAIRASQLGLKTAIVEKQFLGGVCLNMGCIPSKALLKNAEVAHILREQSKEFGFSFDNLKLDFSSAVKRSRNVSDRLVKGVSFLMKKNKIDVFMGTAHLERANSISVMGADNKETKLSTKNVIIATGASSIIPSTWLVDKRKVLTYWEAILQETLPKSVIIIGAGAIGVEFATIWSAYGAKVTIVEMLSHLVPLEDEEVSVELEKNFKKRGINFLTGHKVESVVDTKSGVRVDVSVDGQTKTLEAEQTLVAIGFRPNSKGMGLEELGIKMNEQGFIEIDERMATNVPGIWAIGDVTGKLMLAHVGSAQGIVAAEHIANFESITLNYEMMPRATYCQPQVASFGLTETQAKERGYNVKIGRFPFQANGKALGMADTNGWIKLVVDKKYGEILGAHLIGPEVTELLPELTLARTMELTANEIARNVHAHPTLSEVLMEAAEGIEGSSINI